MNIVEKLKNLIAPEVDTDFEENIEKNTPKNSDEQSTATINHNKYEETIKYPVIFDDDDIFDDFDIKDNDPVEEVVSTINTKRDENTFTRLPRPEKTEFLTKKPFKPSPIISPVYGIISGEKKVATRQINTEAINIKEEPKSNLTFDTIRKKVYGTLEEDIERVIEEGEEVFYHLDVTESIEDNIVEEFVEKQQDLSELTIGEAVDSYEYRGVATDTTKQTRANRNKSKSKKKEEDLVAPKEEIEEVMNLIDEMYQKEEQ